MRIQERNIPINNWLLLLFVTQLCLLDLRVSGAIGTMSIGAKCSDENDGPDGYSQNKRAGPFDPARLLKSSMSKLTTPRIIG